ncbi:hypothetical protein LguiB_017389 [Lonicera macranthoides]
MHTGAIKMGANRNPKLTLELMNKLFYFNLFLVLVLHNTCSQLVLSQSVVKFLPGFQGPLPFHFETGYVGVGESEEVQLFYYFVKSEGNPKEDPVILWLTGGPGCSSFTGLIYEIGPLYFKQVKYNGSLPNLVLNPNSWTKMASILFLDLPVGTGFSYATTSRASQSTDLQMCDQAYQFLQKWLINHPEFISNSVYIGGDSYSGIPVPIITQLISNGNEADINQFINLQGYILGNPLTFPDEGNYAIPFAHGMGLISDELYHSLIRSCVGEYKNINPNNEQCLKDVDAFHKCINGLDTAQILEPACGVASPKPSNFFGERRSLFQRLTKLRDYDPFSSSSAITCRMDGRRLSYYWMNDKSVQTALHIREGSMKIWERCNHNLPYISNILDSRQYHVNLSKKGYRSLVYSGDHDMGVPFLSTQAWIRNLNYSIIDDWRSWNVQGQIAGYTRTYSNKMTFATVKGGGHTAPEYKPAECYAMFKRWISSEPL